MKPLVSILIPCRNEEDYIGNCLWSLDNQDYPNIEIIIVDGMSDDNTINEIASLHIKAKTYFNPKKTMPYAVNKGIRHATGEFIMICGAHSTYPTNYVSECIKTLILTGADNAGGVYVTPDNNQFTVALTSKFGVGKDRRSSGPCKFVDTVFGGCYRREVFEEIGLFNTELTHTQDLEFNYRLRQSGGKIVCNDYIISRWYPRQKTWKAFAKKAFIDGQWVILPVLYCKTPITLRHLVPLVFVITLPLSIWPYMVLNLINSRKWRRWYLLSMAYFTLHVFYGAGSAWACLKVIKEWMKRALSKAMLPGVAY